MTMTHNKRIEELEAQVEHLQDRLDNLRDKFEYLQSFVTGKLSTQIYDRFEELEDYLSIERVVERTHYRKKED